MPGAPSSDAGSCLLRSSGGGSAAVVAAAQLHSMTQFSACCPGLQPSEPKKLPEQAWYWGKGASRPGLDGEAGRSYWIWCRSTGRVPVMNLQMKCWSFRLRTGNIKLDPSIWIKWNVICDIVSDIAYNMVQRTYYVWLKTYCIAYNESMGHRLLWSMMLDIPTTS